MSNIIDKVAIIARLKLTEKEKKKFSKDLKDILTSFSLLDKVNTKNVEPVFQPVEVKNVTREDKTDECLTQKEALSNTKHKEKGHFKGPKVV